MSIVSERVHSEHIDLVHTWAREGRISEDQARLLIEEAQARLEDDPYGVESYESPWDRSPHVSRVWIVAAYHESRRYGGAEEGGWWYTHRDPLNDAYAQRFGRAFVVVGPYTDEDDAWSVARDLNACERISKRIPPSIVWRVNCHVPFMPNGAVYC